MTDLATASPTTAPTTTRPVADLLDPELYRANPHDLWAWMRANEPVYRDERNGLWGITKHADVMDVERRSDVFLSGLGYRAVWSREEVNMIAQDDPRHRQQRMLVRDFFTRPTAIGREPEFRALANELIDEFIDRGSVEVVDGVAGPYPARLTCRLIGFDEAEWPALKVWSERLMRTDMRERSGATFMEFMQANMALFQAVMKVSGERQGCPAHDLMSTWVHGEIDGAHLTQAHIVHEAGLFVAGGAETTRTSIAHGLRAFCDYNDQWDRLADNPALAPRAVDEVLRWVTPLNNFFRRAVAPHVVRGQTIEPGDRIVLLYPSANRDEDVFTDPFRFDITRHPNPHLAFGFGTHVCLGSNIARHSMKVLFMEMSRRMKNLQVIEEPVVEANIFARAVVRFQLGFEKR